MNDDIDKPVDNASQYDFITNYADDRSPKKSKKLKLCLLVLAIVVLITVIVSVIFVMRRDGQDDSSVAIKSTETLQVFEDPLFSMKVPTRWVTSVDYQPGVGLATFISPRLRSAATSISDSDNSLFMKVAVLPKDLAETNDATSAVIKQSYDVTKKEKFTQGGASYNFVEYTLKKVSNDPRTFSIFVRITATKENSSTITGELIASPEQWDHYSSVVTESLKSIRHK